MVENDCTLTANSVIAIIYISGLFHYHIVLIIQLFSMTVWTQGASFLGSAQMGGVWRPANDD